MESRPGLNLNTRKSCVLQGLDLIHPLPFDGRSSTHPSSRPAFWHLSYSNSILQPGLKQLLHAVATSWTSQPVLLLAWALLSPAVPEDCILGPACRNNCSVSRSKLVAISANSISGFEKLGSSWEGGDLFGAELCFLKADGMAQQLKAFCSLHCWAPSQRSLCWLFSLA